MGQTLINMPIQFEPKRKNRFYLSFPNNMIESWLVETTGRPSINIGKTDINYMNTKNYVSGIYTWESITIKFKDAIGPSTSSKIMDWVRLHAESITGRMGYAVGYKKDLILESADPTGIVVERWVMEQCMITSAKFDQNDQSQDGLLMPEITVQPFRCILTY